MAMVSRDPFARQELHKTREKNGECAWCGQLDPAHPRAFEGKRPLRRIYRYRVESDGGRTFEDRHTFCTKACREAYGS